MSAPVQVASGAAAAVVPAQARTAAAAAPVASSPLPRSRGVQSNRGSSRVPAPRPARPNRTPVAGVDGGMRTLLVIHIFAGTVAVLAGTFAVAVPKPLRSRSLLHRRAGRVFQWAMTFVIGSAVLMTIIRFNAYFAGLTAAAMFGVFSGERVLGRKNGERAKALDWLVTLGIIVVASYLGFLLVTRQVTRNVPVVRALSYGTLTYALYDVYRFLRPRGWPFRPRLWLYEHILKMIGGYSGAVAAFSGSVLVIFPPPWRQLWATFAGWILAISMVVYYSRKERS